MFENIFLDNDYYYKYQEIIKRNSNTPKIKFETQGHHIIPRFVFKMHDVPVDNTAANKVNLSYEDHILAHYYLALCVDTPYVHKAEYSFLWLVKRIDMIKSTDNTSEKMLCSWSVEDVKKICTQCVEMARHVNKAMSESNSGGKWMNDSHKQRYVLPTEIEKYLLEGWNIGKLPLTTEQRKNMSKLRKGKKLGPRSDETKHKISKANSGKTISQETRDKISASLKGNIPWNKGQSYDNALKEKCFGEAWIATQFKPGNKPWNVGKSWSEETRKKMSDSAKKRRPSTLGRKIMYNKDTDTQVFAEEKDFETYKELGFTFGKRPISEEHRRHLSEAAKNRKFKGELK